MSPPAQAPMTAATLGYSSNAVLVCSSEEEEKEDLDKLNRDNLIEVAMEAARHLGSSKPDLEAPLSVAMSALL